MKISDSLEDYLSAVYILSDKEPKVRVTDIANFLNVQKSSTNNALNSLKKEGLIIYEKYKNIELTNSGIAVSRQIVKRNNLFKRFLTDILDIDIVLADKEAKSLSHCVSCHTTAKLEQFIETILNKKT